MRELSFSFFIDPSGLILYGLLDCFHGKWTWKPDIVFKVFPAILFVSVITLHPDLCWFLLYCKKFLLIFKIHENPIKILEKNTCGFICIVRYGGQANVIRPSCSLMIISKIKTEMEIRVLSRSNESDYVATHIWSHINLLKPILGFYDTLNNPVEGALGTS